MQGKVTAEASDSEQRVLLQGWRLGHVIAGREGLVHMVSTR